MSAPPPASPMTYAELLREVASEVAIHNQYRHAFPDAAPRQLRELADLLDQISPEDVDALLFDAADFERSAKWCPDGYVNGIPDVITNANWRSKADHRRSLADRLTALTSPIKETT